MSFSVSLRPICEDDLEELAGFGSSPILSGETGWWGYFSEVEIRRQFELTGFLERDSQRLGIEVDGDLVGDVSASRVIYSIIDASCWRVGVTLFPRFRRAGIGTAALDQLCEHLFKTKPTQRIEALVETENTPALKMVEKLNFAREGTLQTATFRSGRWRDLHVYAKIRHN